MNVNFVYMRLPPRVSKFMNDIATFTYSIEFVEVAKERSILSRLGHAKMTENTAVLSETKIPQSHLSDVSLCQYRKVSFDSLRMISICITKRKLHL